MKVREESYGGAGRKWLKVERDSHLEPK